MIRLDLRSVAAIVVFTADVAFAAWAAVIGR